jgi:NADPH:quinone reductase-like Zn-dependent oxidoreductase
MRAVIVSEYGRSPQVEDVPTPEAQAGQVLIKVLAAGMNPMDRATSRTQKTSRRGASPPSTSSFRRRPSCCSVWQTRL